MYHKTKGIILHTTRYSETSVIAKIYTEKFGLTSFLVKGIRSAKLKSKASLMQPMTMLDMEINYRENRNLQFIKEFRRDYNYISVPFDTLKSTIAMLLLEVITKSIREHEPDEEMFEFLYESFRALDLEVKLNPDFHLLFLVHFSRYLGFMPHGNFSGENCYFEMQEGVFTATVPGNVTVLNKHESGLLAQLLSTPLYATVAIKISRAERKMMLRQLIKYYQLHLENFSLKSPDILEVILD
jgi:DNA repair protein RecO (recombination protein O)